MGALLIPRCGLNNGGEPAPEVISSLPIDDPSDSLLVSADDQCRHGAVAPLSYLHVRAAGGCMQFKAQRFKEIDNRIPYCAIIIPIEISCSAS
jgi:hypothetical protein